MTTTAEPAPPVDAVTAMTGGMRPGARLFITVGDQPRARRATDVLLLTTSLTGILMIGLIAVPEPGFSRAITRFMVGLPDALVGMWQLFADLPIMWGLIVLGAAFVRGRGKIARDMLFALAVGAMMWLVISRIVNGSWPELAVIWSDAAPPPVFPSARLGIPTALLVTASPHLVRPARRFGYVVISLGAIAAVALDASTTLGVAAALLSAAGAAAIVHLVVGSSAGRPSLDDVRYALNGMKVPVVEIGAADRQDAGQFAVAARGVDGSRLVVKLYGRDAHDAALVSAVWRAIWLRRPGAPVGLGRLRQVEHEALLTLLAAQAGIRTDSVVTAGATHSDDAVLVLQRTAEPLVARARFADLIEPPPPLFTGADAAARLDEIWRLVSTLHDRGIVHGRLDEDRLVLDDGRLGLIDFRGAAVAPTEAQERSDNAQMLVTTIGLAGRDAAVSALLEHRSPEQIEAFLPYLQPTALTPDQRRMTKVMGIDLDDLRADVAAASGLESPPLIRLRRFTIGSVVRVGLPGLAIVMMISALAGIDLAAFVESLRDAAWVLVLIGFLIAQLPRLAQAVSTLGAAPIPLPLGPVYALQLAISYVNLAIPTAAARIAVNIRFFQRQGVAPAAAVATGALDGVSGFIVQATLLGSLLLFSSMSLGLEVSGPSSSALQIVLIIGIVVAIIVVVILAVARLRRIVLGWVRSTAQEAFGVLRGLRSLRRVVMLFGGNLAAELLFAASLGIFVQAFGYSLPLHELLFINMAVSLLAGLLPIPGGIGVAEGGLVFGLTSFGVPQEAAFAAVMLYRFSTFYLPPIWGFFSLNWLERNRYL